MEQHPFHDLFVASAGVFAALWVVFTALAIFIAQQRASTGAKLTFASALTPARAMLANAYFFTGMQISLVGLLPQPDGSVRFWGELLSLTFTYSPFVLLLVLAFIAKSEIVWQAFGNMTPFYLVASLPIWGALYAANDRASTAVFLLLGFGCLWTLIAVWYLIFYANEWSSAARFGGSPEDLEATNAALADILKRGKILNAALAEHLEAQEERAQRQEQQIALLVKIEARVKELLREQPHRDQDEDK